MEERTARRIDAQDTRAGFTLIEMLLVTALIGLFATLFVVNIGTIGSNSLADTVETQFWSAVREGRSRAVVERRAQTLRFDKAKATFLVEDEGDGTVRSFPVRHENLTEGSKLEIVLQKRLQRGQFSLQQGQLVDLREIPSARFFPDGSCTPFVVTLGIDGVEREIDIDPWTGAERLPEEKNAR